MYGKFIKHPIAITGLSQVLLQKWPKLGGKRSVQVASMILDGLHRLGLQIGPAEAFGEGSPRQWQEAKRQETQKTTSVDPWKSFGEIYAEIEEKRPWEIR